MRTSIGPSGQMICYSTCGLEGKGSFPASCLGEGTLGVFEEIEVMLPQDYDTYLKTLYGDYMKLPPKEQRVPHHYCTIIDPDKPYLNYLKKSHLNGDMKNYSYEKES